MIEMLRKRLQHSSMHQAITRMFATGLFMSESVARYCYRERTDLSLWNQRQRDAIIGKESVGLGDHPTNLHPKERELYQRYLSDVAIHMAT